MIFKNFKLYNSEVNVGLQLFCACTQMYEDILSWESMKTYSPGRVNSKKSVANGNRQLVELQLIEYLIFVLE